ncbi:twin-arginine translocase TatA/TatE family subunit [Brumimicrobium salinarum]|uniref:Sec-independent protein translocase protein TatA n=1 Tax=Brumimicrobium salinarum TaxID=2058658 RepID=A0A2I0QZC4_9FLAO|nr:twin-arginine translocase TatA/TatE family subunit [Brumimicrobium salinarum]
MILGMFGPWQIVLVVVVILLLFGGRKIPELMKGLGKGMKEFKDATKNDEDEGGTQENENNKKYVKSTYSCIELLRKLKLPLKKVGRYKIFSINT